MLRILNSLSSCDDVDVFLHGNSVVQHFAVFSPPDVIQWISVWFSGVPSWKYRWMASVLFLTCLFQHLFRLVVHSLSFRRSVLGPTTAALLNHVSRDWGVVTAVLVELWWTPPGFHISSTATNDFTQFPVGIAIRTLLFGRIFAKFEDLVVVQVGEQVLRFFAELVDLLRLTQVLNEWFFMFCGSRTSPSTFWLCSRVLYSAARLQKEVLQIFCNPLCCYRFLRNFSNRSMAPKMILRLGFVALLTILRVRFQYDTW